MVRGPTVTKRILSMFKTILKYIYTWIFENWVSKNINSFYYLAI